MVKVLFGSYLTQAEISSMGVISLRKGENVTQINRRVVKRDCDYSRFLFLCIYIFHDTIMKL